MAPATAIEQRTLHKLSGQPDTVLVGPPAGKSAPGKDILGSRRVARLYEYWSSKRSRRAMPARSDIDPGELKPLLPYLLISELSDDPVRVRYRLAGARVVEAFGHNITGHWLHELTVVGGVDAWTSIYERVRRTRAPVLGVSEALLGRIKAFDCPWAVLPLSSDGERVDQCLEIEDWNTVRPLARYNDDDLRWFLRISA